MSKVTQVTPEQSGDAIPKGYVSVRQAMEILGKSHATIERYITAGEFPSQLIPRAGRKPERVFEEAALRTFKAREEERKERRPPSQLEPKAPPAANAQALAVTNFALDKIAAAGVGLASSLDAYMQRTAQSVPIPQKLWWSLEEAHAMTGFAIEDLRRLAATGKVTARKSNGWRIQRQSLEAFEG